MTFQLSSHHLILNLLNYKVYVSAVFDWKDAFNLEVCLTEEEVMVRDQFKSYCQEKLMPRIVMGNRNEGWEL